MRIVRQLRGARLVGAAGFVAVLGVIAVTAVVVIGSAFGYRAVIIKSGSMIPTLRVGSLAVDTSVDPTEVHPGQIVTFRDPALDEQLVTHRIMSVRRVGTAMVFVTKGDANRTTEHWSVPVTGHLGKVLFSVPAVGRVLIGLQSALARVLGVIALAAWAMAALLRSIWRHPGRPGAAAVEASSPLAQD